MARYGQAFKDRAVARLLPPESASLTDVAREFGVSVQTLQKWRDAALSPPAAAQARDGVRTGNNYLGTVSRAQVLGFTREDELAAALAHKKAVAQLDLLNRDAASGEACANLLADNLAHGGRGLQVVHPNKRGNQHRRAAGNPPEIQRSEK